eukprot:5934280-Lingulodinium_polyedra.AAC.1
MEHRAHRRRPSMPPVYSDSFADGASYYSSPKGMRTEDATPAALSTSWQSPRATRAPGDWTNGGDNSSLITR